MVMETEQLLTSQEAASVIGLSKTRVEQLRRAGEIEGILLGPHPRCGIVYRRSEAERVAKKWHWRRVFNSQRAASASA